VRFRGFRVEHLMHAGWEAYRVERYVNWCGHAQEVIPIPRPDGPLALVPALWGGDLMADGLLAELTVSRPRRPQGRPE
jgi:hypothetical protein